MSAHAVIFCALLCGAFGALNSIEGSRFATERNKLEKTNEETDNFNQKQIDISQLQKDIAFRTLLNKFRVKDITPSLGGKETEKDGQNGIQVKVLDSDDPATEEFIRKVLRENGQTKNKPGELNKQPKVQSNDFVDGSETIDGEGIAAEIDHKEEPVFIKFIEIENEDSEQDIIEKILKSQNPESFYAEQDFLKLEGDDSPWASLLKNSINSTHNLIDPKNQTSKFLPDIITSAPKLVSSKSSATTLSSKSSATTLSSKSFVTKGKMFEQNAKKLKTLDEGPCQMRTPSLQEVESAISTMTLSPNEKPKARVVLDIIKSIHSKADENRRRENTAGFKTFLKSPIDPEESAGKVVDNNVLSSDKFSSIDIKGGKIVEHKDGFVVADSNGSERDVRVQVLYLGEPETEAFIQSVLQMDESEPRKNTKFTILKDSQDLEKDWQLEVIDNERLKKLIKHEQPIDSSDVARDWFNFENITKTTVQILKPQNGNQIKQHGTQPSENESKITISQRAKLQKGRSNSLASSPINQENLKTSSDEKFQGTKLVKSGSVLGNRVNLSQKENFKKIIIGVKKIDTIEAASSINREEQINSNTTKTNAKHLEEIDYSESVLQLPKNVTNDANESSNDEWLENTSQYGTDLFSEEDFTKPEYQEEIFVPTKPQDDRFDVNGINSDGVHKALFFKTKYSIKSNYEGTDEPEISEEQQDMFTAETSGFPEFFISQPPTIKEGSEKTEQDEDNVEKANKENENVVKARNNKQDTVKIQQDKEVAANVPKYEETAAKVQKIKEADVKAQKDKEVIAKAQKNKEDSVKAQTPRNDALRAKTVKETAPKDRKSYGNMMKELGVTVTDQEAEDEEKLIEAATNFEQKHMVARSWEQKDIMKGTDQVARTKTQVDRRTRRKARALPNDRRQNPNQLESSRRQKSNYPIPDYRFEGPNRPRNRQPISEADTNGPIAWMRYYRHPIEAHRFDYQSIVRQTRDYGEPIAFSPAYFRPNHGYGFNEWGGLGAAP